MADISKLILPDGNEYNFKDKQVRDNYVPTEYDYTPSNTSYVKHDSNGILLNRGNSQVSLYDKTISVTSEDINISNRIMNLTNDTPFEIARKYDTGGPPGKLYGSLLQLGGNGPTSNNYAGLYAYKIEGNTTTQQARITVQSTGNGFVDLKGGDGIKLWADDSKYWWFKNSNNLAFYSDQVKGTAPSANNSMGLYYCASNGNDLGSVRFWHLTSKKTQAAIYTYTQDSTSASDSSYIEMVSPTNKSSTDGIITIKSNTINLSGSVVAGIGNPLYKVTEISFTPLSLAAHSSTDKSFTIPTGYNVAGIQYYNDNGQRKIIYGISGNGRVTAYNPTTASFSASTNCFCRVLFVRNTLF